MEAVEAIDRARALVPLLRERASEADSQRRMSDDTMRTLTDSGMFRLVQPRRFGGHQLGAETFVESMVEISRGDGSAGWITSLTAAHNKWAGFFPIEGQEEMYGDDSDLRFPLVVAPQGQATPIDGGYDLSGTWDYVSGCDVCNWLGLTAVIPGAAKDGPPAGVISAVIRASEYHIEDNWHVEAMRGTGSKRAVIDGVYVPLRRTIRLGSDGEPVGSAPLGGSDEGFFRAPMLPLFICELGAVAVGVGRAFVELFAERAQGKTSPFPPYGTLSDSEAVQARLGRAAGTVDRAHRVLVGVARDYDAAARTSTTFYDEIETRRALIAVQGLVLDVCSAVEALGTVAGSSVVREGEPLMRAWRDLIAIRTHYLLDSDRTALNLGRLLVGLNPISRN
ncbi:MAG: hypothetical protein P8L46_03720 [Acidimicrobiales bacterium]|nr:hypothetical protein [Acidimicrobiales bacterium]MDG2217130.1 hypothetical protein [Acidimicrobiales bacterium]